MAEIISFIKNLDSDTKEKMIIAKVSDAINKYYATKDPDDKREADRQVGWELIGLSLKIRLNLPENMQRMAQMGFCIIEYKYENEENVKEYFAIHMLKMIMASLEKKLEDKLHNEYKSKDDVLKKGVNTIILEVIAEEDYYLKEYLITRLYLLSDMQIKFNEILNRWDNYELKDIVNYDEINFMIDQFIKKYPEFLLKRDVVVAYIEKEFNINFGEYYGYNKEEIYKSLNLEPINYDEELKLLSLDEQHKLLEIKKIVAKSIKSKVKNASYDELLIKCKRKNK